LSYKSIGLEFCYARFSARFKLALTALTVTNAKPVGFIAVVSVLKSRMKKEAVKVLENPIGFAKTAHAVCCFPATASRFPLKLIEQFLQLDLALTKLAALHLENVLNNPSVSFPSFPQLANFLIQRSV